MNRIVADSGSTKTEWIILKNNVVVGRKITSGLNASYMTKEILIQNITNELDAEFLNCENIDIYYYGAGCSGVERVNKMMEALAASFPYHHELTVHNDLMAAAQASCGDQPGICAIMGTGSNLAYYTGKNIKHLYAVGGYLLADEGGGVSLGKSLIQHYLYRELDDELIDKFFKKYQLSDDEIIVKLYKSNRPNQFMASFCPFLSEHQSHPQIDAIIKGCLNNFFLRHVLKYKNEYNLDLYICGSIGDIFREQINSVAASHNVRIGGIIKSPMQNLIAYHQSRA